MLGSQGLDVQHTKDIILQGLQGWKTAKTGFGTLRPSLIATLDVSKRDESGVSLYSLRIPLLVSQNQQP